MAWGCRDPLAARGVNGAHQGRCNHEESWLYEILFLDDPTPADLPGR